MSVKTEIARKEKWPRTGTSVAWAIVLIAACCTLFPLVWLVLMSLKDRAENLAVPPVWIFVPHLENYTSLLTTFGFDGKLLNSVIVGIGGTVLALVIGGVGAYALSRGQFRAKNALLFLILAVRMYPPITTVVPIFLIAAWIGAIDSRLTLAIVYASLQLPMVLYLVKNFVDDIPIEMEEAASIDGASRLQIMLRVVLPLARPGLLAAGVLAFIMNWNEFMFALVLTSKSAVTAPVGLSGFVEDHEILWGQLGAIGVLTILPVMILGILIRRHLARGLAFGAIQ